MSCVNATKRGWGGGSNYKSAELLFFEIIINVLISVYVTGIRPLYGNLFSAGIDFRRQILKTEAGPRAERFIPPPLSHTQFQRLFWLLTISFITYVCN